MTTDLTMLLFATILTWVQIVVAATPSILSDMNWALGNREEEPEREGFEGRAHRAAQNMKENLPLFTALVLVAHTSGSSDASTALGAQTFVAARVLHMIAYYAGIPYARTGLWAVSVAGMGMIAAACL